MMIFLFETDPEATKLTIFKGVPKNYVILAIVSFHSRHNFGFPTTFRFRKTQNIRKFITGHEILTNEWKFDECPKFPRVFEVTPVDSSKDFPKCLNLFNSI